MLIKPRPKNHPLLAIGQMTTSSERMIVTEAPVVYRTNSLSDHGVMELSFSIDYRESPSILRSMHLKESNMQINDFILMRGKTVLR
jgi:hypothetical protein